MLKPEILDKFSQLLRNKEWQNNVGYEIVFERLCKILVQFDKEQQDLMFELLERYVWLSGKEYDANIIRLLEQVDKDKLDKVKKIFLIPIVKPSDLKKTKSAHAVLYSLRSLKPFIKSYEKIKFIEKNIQSNDIETNDEQIIFLIDDFIGSGDTLQKALAALKENIRIKSNHINILTIAIQADTYGELNNNQLSIYANNVLEKGITDFYEPTIVSKKISLMKEIEKYIESKSYSFGYKKAEMLITLLRTPNNTFPVFWDKYRINDEIYTTPFSRY